MGTFVNDSGVIIASYNNEVIRFEKDGLQIFTDNKNVVLVSIQQNQRIERRYLASAISSPSNSGADDLKRKLFLMLEDYGAGGGDGVTDLQGAYDGGNVVNDADVIIDGGATHIFAVGLSAAGGNTGNNVIALGSDAALNNSGDYVTAIGEEAAKSNIGNDVNSMGRFSAEENTNDQLNAIGLFAGYKNTGFRVNAIGGEGVGQENTGDYLNAIGTGCGFKNTGEYVNGIGMAAAQENAGDNVNAFGNEAGYQNTADDSNFFGKEAGKGNTTAFGVTVFSPESIPSYANKGAADTALTVANGCVAGQIYIFRNEANDNIGFIIPSA
jgi:hypothetical protein